MSDSINNNTVVISMSDLNSIVDDPEIASLAYRMSMETSDNHQIPDTTTFPPSTVTTYVGGLEREDKTNSIQEVTQMINDFMESSASAATTMSGVVGDISSSNPAVEGKNVFHQTFDALSLPSLLPNLASSGSTKVEFRCKIGASDDNKMDISSLQSPMSSSEVPSSTATSVVPASYCPLDKSVETVSRYNFCVAGQDGCGKTSFCYSTFQQTQHFPNFSMCKTKKTMKDDVNRLNPVDDSTRNQQDQVVVDGGDGGHRGGNKGITISECGRGETIVGSNERIIVTIVDTGGYGNYVNNSSHITALLEYIERQNEAYECAGIYRNRDDRSKDTRIHCLFYLFVPHRVQHIDIEFLRSLQKRVPIVPIISKADTLTAWELAEQLHLIHTRLSDAGIDCFDFEESDIDESWLEQRFDTSTFTRLGRAMEGVSHGPTGTIESEDVATEAVTGTVTDSQARPRIRNVFAVISGNRKYNYGTASGDDSELSDTKRLHTVLFRSLGKLRKQTDAIHEEWRSKRLRKACLIFHESRFVVDTMWMALGAAVSLYFMGMSMGDVPFITMELSMTRFAILVSELIVGLRSVGLKRGAYWFLVMLCSTLVIDVALSNARLAVLITTSLVGIVGSSRFVATRPKL